nr:hypothetical protein Ade03nite_69060 [Actinoplanes derwentensis]
MLDPDAVGTGADHHRLGPGLVGSAGEDADPGVPRSGIDSGLYARHDRFVAATIAQPDDERGPAVHGCPPSTQQLAGASRSAWLECLSGLVQYKDPRLFQPLLLGVTARSRHGFHRAGVTPLCRNRNSGLPSPMLNTGLPHHNDGTSRSRFVPTRRVVC